MTSVEITRHVLVPKHEILSEGEKREVLKAFDATESQLPKIVVSDPVIQLIGARSGNVIRITRKSPTAGEAVYYRIVVEK
ncbi:MAG: DNA-directed RNA polymerase subunit H [Candidatus Aenigmarchaeota archaeon]|nr:DNA-directed RNA polymerase subunit H [Candidatus Aenigmarchaeota archaeon]